MNDTVSPPPQQNGAPGIAAPDAGIPARALSDAHREYLNEHAISDEVIAAQGIWSDGQNIVFTWREGEHVTEQRRPWPGKSGEYYWTPGEDLHLDIVRDPSPEATILLCEGTKQHLAVASWAPPQYAVYGMPGCYGWTMSRKLDLSRFAGRRMLIMLDADAAGNLDVYEAGERLASELSLETPPAEALFIPSPSWGKNGIDDYLSRIAESRRADRLAKLIERAQATPADRKPSKRPRQIPDTIAPDTGGRPMVVVNADRRDIIRQILQILKDRWDGSELFSYGGALTRLREAATEPLERDPFLRWLAEGAACYLYREPDLVRPGKYEPAWPDNQTVSAVLASGDEFAQLKRVSRTPFARPDGTICAKNGYDAVTATMLVTGNSGMDRLGQRGELDEPTQDEAAEAARYLLTDWLGDFPWRDATSRANALALVLTPFIRGLVPIVPLAVISGLQPGVGKNLLADCVELVISGESVPPLPWLPDDDDENRKQITSAFRAGASLIWFDEAHLIGGHTLTRAITSLTYADRLLGVNKQVSWPNQVTWLATGNQVEVLADMGRRAYWIELHPDVPDPENRPESDFSHPELRGWTRENRPELVTKVLVLIRAWFAADCPAYNRGSLMGSFEAWDKMLSGILAYAGVDGFLASMAERRAERDTSGGYWAEHLSWLYSQFGPGEFTVLDVRTRALGSAGAWDGPPKLDEPDDRGFARNLGAAYSKVPGRYFGAYRLLKMGIGHRKVQKWRVQSREEEMAAGGTPDPQGPGPGRDWPDSPGSTPLYPSNPSVSGVTQPDLGGRDVEGLPASQIDNGTVTNQDSRPEGWRDREGSTTPDVRPGAAARTHAGVRAREGAAIPPLPSIPPAGLSLTIDLETADAGQLFTYEPHDGTGFIRIAGVLGPSGQPVITGAAGLAAILPAAATIDGHNIAGFDGIALAAHAGVDWETFAARARDTEIIARQAFPPRSKRTHSDDRYDLDTVAGLLGLPGKTDDITRLKTRHHGYDKIPLDDPEYRRYLEGDLHASAAVGARLLPYYDSDPYIRREHQAASLAGRMSLNGFRVNRKLLADRLAEGEQRKRDAQQVLAAGWGLPLGKMVSRGRGKAKHEVFEEDVSPLSTDTGRAWLETMWARYEIGDPPRTDTGKLALGADELAKIAARPGIPGELVTMLGLMGVVTTTRTVYQTLSGCLAADGRVHPTISMRQSSGRWSTTNPGLTVLGKHDGRHIERDPLIPDEGHVLFSCDLSQVDMRGIAALSQDEAYMELFQPGRDAHAWIAAQVFHDAHAGNCPKGCPLRQDAKSRGHGWNYGMGPERMVRDGVPAETAYGFDAGMRQAFPVLCAWREEIRNLARAGGILDNGFGRRMRCDPSSAHTVAPALMGQGSAGDIMKAVLLRLDARHPEYRPYYRVMVHDEQVFSVPEDQAETIMAEVKDAFTWEWAPPGAAVKVPILAEINGPGMSWGEISSK